MRSCLLRVRFDETKGEFSMSKLTCSYRPKIYSRCMLLLYVVITIVGVSACQPKEFGLPFETIEKRDASGTGQVYEDKQPGLIIIAKPEEVANLDALVTPMAKHDCEA